MDYEKEYKKLKAGIEKAYLFAQTDSTKAVLEHILPELAESESGDERIRKEILDHCKDKAEKYSNDPKYKNISAWIAWLEKQVPVDKDKIVEGIRRGVAISLINHIDANSKGMCLSNMECKDIENAIINEDWDKVYGYMKKKLEKQNEHNPADKTEQKPLQWNISDYRTWPYIVSDVLTKHAGIGQYLDDGFCKKIAKYMQENWSKKLSLVQKPAEWSKDYTERMGQIIDYLKCQAKEEPTRKRTLLGWVMFLKSIFRKGLPEIQIPGTEAARKGIHRIMDVLDWAADKGRISDSDCEDYIILLSAYLPQSRPTWSKADKRMMDLIISIFEVNHPKSIFKEGLRAVYTDEIVSWLKSIEDRMKGE